MGIKPLEQKPLRGFSYVEGVGDGIAQCAASPWTYRTDTGDEHGKVVESAELPLKPGWYICTQDNHVGYYFLVMQEKASVNRENLRKHLISYAEIRQS